MRHILASVVVESLVLDYLSLDRPGGETGDTEGEAEEGEGGHLDSLMDLFRLSNCTECLV